MRSTQTTIVKIRKYVSAVLLVSFIIVGLVDALSQGKTTYSSIMGMDIDRVYFYTFFLLVIGCWLLYHKYLVGVGFIALASFSAYFLEYVSLHNYFASIVIYVGLFLDIILKKKYAWLILFLALGIVQGVAFQFINYSNYIVGSMEFLSLCAGTLFIAKTVE
jgi:hypothetical protein